MKTAAALALAALAVRPAAAQEYRREQARAAELSYQDLQSAASAGRARAENSKARSYALEAALTAMNDGPEAGGRITRFLQDAKTDVFFATQDAPAAAGEVNGRKAILLSDALPAKPRVYAPLIAAQAARSLYADMPACAEREYMRAATAARVFAELGGDFKALPSVDGEDAPAVRDATAAWATDAQTALDNISRATGLAALPDLEAAAKTPQEASALQAADRAFVAFLLDERDARREAGR